MRGNGATLVVLPGLLPERNDPPTLCNDGWKFPQHCGAAKLFYDLLPKTWEALVALREQRKLAAILAAAVVGYSRQTARR